MLPTRWLSMSASVSSLRRSHASSTALSTASARSRYSESVIARIAAMPSICRIVGRRAVGLVLLLSMALPGCGQKGPLTLPSAAPIPSSSSTPTDAQR
ncbi:LPS translocon maturation chaperone LptM [Tepidimonas sp.]|uniref:LPS translocon maturation chaperone LptM n=1 Tax=Tepidimonas sp. TaxID=2002775 RepID=UPI0039A30315